MNYVVGFLFERSLAQVALIHKARPDYLAGLWNGLGGKVELGETSVVAVDREVWEESGAWAEAWIQVATMDTVRGDCIKIYAGRRSSASPYPVTRETEEVALMYVPGIPLVKTVPNVQWLVPMCVNALEDKRLDGPDWSHIYMREVPYVR